MTPTPVSPDAFMKLGMGFMASKTFLSAVELGLFTELAKSPRDGENLRRHLGLHERSARDFLDALVALGVIEREGQSYRNTPAADLYLDRAKPSYIGGLFEMLSGRLYRFWSDLTPALQTGKPQNEAKSGESPFAAIYADPATLESFLKAMTGASIPNARAIAATFPWRDYRSFADIGGAQGGCAVEIARAHPHLTGVGFDLPPVGPIFSRYIADQGLADRLRFQPGDFFVDPLPHVDVLIMGHILHDWDLPTKKMLLRKAHQALPEDGALIVYDVMIDDDRRANVAGLMMSLNMLIETPGGFDYTGADCIEWMRETGFREARQHPLAGEHSMVVGVK